MSKNYDYDSNYEPAAPVALIGLSPSGETNVRQEVVALLDSGADATMIPADILTLAGARFVEQRQMRGIVGKSITVNLYLAAVHIGEHIVHGVRAIAVSPGDESIVGRDVLNQLEVLLNGPAHEVWIR